MKRLLFNLFKIALIMYILLCTLMYFMQEKMIFHPDKLDKNFKYEFAQSFQELNIPVKENTQLNGLLFKADSSKGVILYLHGNAGSLASWGKVANIYTNLQYDVFMPDYRGFGKSDGKIKNEDEFYKDLQITYDSLKRRYNEDNIVVLGYSIGTGPAAQLASTNHPKLLVLQAPYYSLTDMMKKNYPIIPRFLLKYKFSTNEFVQACKMPIVIFHGDKDEVIDYDSSTRLKELMKPGDRLITLNGQTHNGMGKNPEYLKEIKGILR